MYRRRVAVAIGVVSLVASAAAFKDFDFGVFREHMLDSHSEQLFGIVGPVDESSSDSITRPQANADPTALVTLARGLRARVLTASANAGTNIDMMALWPDSQSPTHLIACNEGGATEPGLQRIRLSDGAVETIVTGTADCDPVKRTAWGTIVFGEEGSPGWLMELINPLSTTGVTFNRNTGVFSGGVGASNLTVRPAVGRLAFEGLALLPNGVLYYGDENRPLNGAPGGAYFKFIPSAPASGPIASLSQSPLAAGRVYGLRLGKRNNADNGQGSNTGLGNWIPIDAALIPDLRGATAALKLTGYYRPEDAEIDPAALSEGLVRFCGNNTGNESQDRNWGETICVSDGTVQEATANTASPEVQYLVIGTPDFAMMDNLAYQPGRGNWIIHEDGDGPSVGRNNDLWSCVDDGDDADFLSDGCARVGTLNDLTAEWTGGVFDASGQHFYVSVQHNISGHGVVLDITGWR